MRKLKKSRFCNIFKKVIIIMIKIIIHVSGPSSSEIYPQHEYKCSEDKNCPQAQSPDCPVNKKNTS
ncbi:hypothetical protein EV682_101291 [Iodobacter fluviatilis]|uniref:Uncharacterized protein n=1 Tax=Iodobacter fluviatilis TaxID=537 RepID=A0A377Q2Y0_9NEIS|nr:hypothetical protein EV682_101291 [Iodobacter fluviatilis]STQ89293.1 Uncharacterised protein [Iodobacter fluviatilis]